MPHTASERRNSPDLVLLSSLALCRTNCFLAEVNRSSDNTACKFTLILGADRNSFPWWSYKWADRQAHPGPQRPQRGKSSQCFSWSTGISQVWDSGKESSFHKQNNCHPCSHPPAQKLKVEAKTDLSHTSCAPIFLSEFAFINSEITLYYSQIFSNHDCR